MNARVIAIAGEPSGIHDAPQPISSNGFRYHSDDNAHVEQKNWTWARHLLGYGRLEDPELVTPISARYREVWAPWQNFFLPMRLPIGSSWTD